MPVRSATLRVLYQKRGLGSFPCVGISRYRVVRMIAGDKMRVDLENPPRPGRGA
jgi:hypothetical protein